MRKLLSANFYRLKKEKLFYMILIATFAFSFGEMWIRARSWADSGLELVLDECFFSMAPYMGFIYGIFVSLFLGGEYSDGMIRNKVIAGHTRRDIYLANVISCFGGNMMLAAAWLLGSVPGIFLIGRFQMQTAELLAYLLVVVGFTAVFTGLFVWLSMLPENKAVTVVLAIVLWLALTMVASQFNDRLSEVEMTGGVAFIDGEMVNIEPEPNPLYLSGAVRVVCECILDALPTGQAILMHDASIVHPLRELLFSLLLTSVILTAGIAVFRKKDLK